VVSVSAESENVVSAAVSVTAVTEKSGFSRSLVTTQEKGSCKFSAAAIELYCTYRSSCLQCFDTVGWAAGRASGCKKMGDGGGGHWLVQIEWRPARWLMCLPLLIFPIPCTIKSRSSLLAPAHLGGPKKGHRTVVVVHMQVHYDVL